MKPDYNRFPNDKEYKQLAIATVSTKDLEIGLKRLDNNSQRYKWGTITIAGYQLTKQELQQEIRERKLKELGI